MYKARLTQTPQLTQRTTITPRLQQALKVLNMPLQELTHFITQQVEQNPFLELESESETTPTVEDLDPAPEWNEPEQNPDIEDTAVDIDWETAFEDRISISERMNTGRYVDPEEPPPDVAYERSLHEHLTEQLYLAVPDILASETEYAIGEQILGNLNDDGQLHLKLFQMPCEFLKPLNAAELSTELHTFIQENLQTATGDKTIEFSEAATVTFQKTVHTVDSSEVCPPHLRWKIDDPENHKTYTVIYEQVPGNCEPVLNLYQLTLADIAETIGCETSLVETVLRKIQDNFEPVGIAYRDVREALLIQIRNYPPDEIDEDQIIPIDGNGGQVPGEGEVFFKEKVSLHALAREIVENYFDAFLNQQWHCIEAALKVDRTVVNRVVRWIGRLSPHPGRSFIDPATRSLKASPRADTITPDVEVQYLNGKYQVIAVDSYIPRLQMNPYYLNLMRNRKDTLDTEAKVWIEKRYREATDLLSSLVQRGSTIARVTETIFEIQTDFLTQGPKAIKPLALRMIAEKIGVHESTVSRVTSNKYVQTPHGIYPLRFFFSNQLATTQGEGVSAKQVKNLIEEIIAAEAPAKPLSDQAISNALKAKGVLLARRTVQKYRDELGIPASRERSAIRASAAL